MTTIKIMITMTVIMLHAALSYLHYDEDKQIPLPQDDDQPVLSEGNYWYWYQNITSILYSGHMSTDTCTYA